MKNFKFLLLAAAAFLLPYPAQAQRLNVNVTGYTNTADPCQQVTAQKFPLPVNTATAATFTLVPPAASNNPITNAPYAPFLCYWKTSVSGTSPTIQFGTAYGTVPTPVIQSAQQATTGGTLAASTTYTYRISATNAAGETLASAEFSVTTAASTATNTITLSATGFNGATGCNVYGRTAGAELKLTTGTLANGVCTYTDTNGATPSGALPTANTTAGSATCAPITGVITVATGTYLTLGDGGGTFQVQGNPGGSICYIAGGTTPSVQGYFVGVYF
jgi:hypothetical protein